MGRRCGQATCACFPMLLHSFCVPCSNFDYLMHLNREAGRSFKDLSQYPVSRFAEMHLCALHAASACLP